MTMRHYIRNRISEKQIWFTLNFAIGSDNPKYLSKFVQGKAIEKFTNGRLKSLNDAYNRNEVKTIFVSQKWFHFLGNLSIFSYKTRLQIGLNGETIHLFVLRSMMRFIYVYSLIHKNEVLFIFGNMEKILLANPGILELIDNTIKDSDRIFSLRKAKIEIYVDYPGYNIDVELPEVLRVMDALKSRGPLHQIERIYLLVYNCPKPKIELIQKSIRKNIEEIEINGLSTTLLFYELDSKVTWENQQEMLRFTFVTKNVSMMTLENCFQFEQDLVLASLESPLKLKNWSIYF